jgi:hypothetical protein
VWEGLKLLRVLFSGTPFPPFQQVQELIWAIQQQGIKITEDMQKLIKEFNNWITC